MSKSLGQSQVKTSQAWHHKHNLYKKKIFDKLYFVNIFKFCPMKDPVKWVERQAMEKIVANHIFNKDVLHLNT